MYHPLLLVQSIDSSALGRVDPSQLSDQVRMELLISGIISASITNYRDASGDFRDVCDWDGVECDESQFVRKIALYTGNCFGELNLDFLPPSVREFRTIEASALQGTLNTATFPRGLQVFVVHAALSSSVDLTVLPHALTTWNISGNKFSGSCDLTKLPKNLRTLYISQNGFFGSLCAAQLPDTLQYASLTSCAFSGEVDLEHLPPRMLKLSLKGNKFTGSVSFANLPKWLAVLNIARNEFSGSLVFEDLPVTLRLLQVERNAFSGEFRFREPIRAIQRVDASGNRFSGVAVISREAQPSILLGGNDLTGAVDELGEAYADVEKILSRSSTAKE